MTLTPRGQTALITACSVVAAISLYAAIHLFILAAVEIHQWTQ